MRRIEVGIAKFDDKSVFCFTLRNLDLSSALGNDEPLNELEQVSASKIENVELVSYHFRD